MLLKENGVTKIKGNDQKELRKINLWSWKSCQDKTFSDKDFDVKSYLFIFICISTTDIYLSIYLSIVGRSYLSIYLSIYCRSNNLWQSWSCGLVHCPGWKATDPIWRVLASSDGISCWTPLKPQHINPKPKPNPLANQLWCIDFLTPPILLIIPHRLSAFLESLMPLKNWCSIHARCFKSSLKHSIRFCGRILSMFRIEFYCISFL